MEIGGCAPQRRDRLTELLVWRDRLRLFYRDYGRLLQPLWRFFLSIAVIVYMNQVLGYDKQLKNIFLVLGISAVSAFVPVQLFVVIMAGFAFLHVYAAASLLAFLVLGIFLVLFLLFQRFAPSYGYVLVLMPIAMSLHIPLFPVLLIGLTAEPAGIVAAGCGIVVYSMFRVLKVTILGTVTELSLENMAAAYQSVMDAFLHDKEMFLYLFAVSVVILVVYLIRRLMIAHAFQAAVLAGSILFLTVMLMGELILRMNVSPAALLAGSVISAVLAAVIQFLLLPLDYSRVETVQFDDDDYYYYVRAVPKMQVAAPKKQVKRINVQKVTENTVNLQEAVQQVQGQEGYKGETSRPLSAGLTGRRSHEDSHSVRRAAPKDSFQAEPSEFFDREK